MLDLRIAFSIDFLCCGLCHYNKLDTLLLHVHCVYSPELGNCVFNLGYSQLAGVFHNNRVCPDVFTFLPIILTIKCQSLPMLS